VFEWYVKDTKIYLLMDSNTFIRKSMLRNKNSVEHKLDTYGIINFQLSRKWTEGKMNEKGKEY